MKVLIGCLSSIVFILVAVPIYLIGPNHLFSPPINSKVLSFNQKEIKLQRTDAGMMTVHADDMTGSFYGLGYAHALDRTWQMAFLRIVAQGRLSELLESSELTNKLDINLRQLGFASQSESAILQLKQEDPTTFQYLEAYSQGVNQYFENEELTWEFRLTGTVPEPWKPEDSLSILRVMFFVGLADTQGNLEKFIVQSLQIKKSHQVLQALFRPFLDEIQNITAEDQKIFDDISIGLNIIPVELKDFVPQLRASNNWVVAANQTASGFPFHASDPHLNILQIPPIWYETQLNLADGYFLYGATVPGIPAVVFGRNPHLTWSLTYGFMDHIDYFVEKCNDHSCLVDGQWEPIQKQNSTILRKGTTPLEITVYRTRHGIIEIEDPTAPLKEGLYLARAYAHEITRGLPSFYALKDMLKATDVKSAQNALKQADISANWLFTDKKNIGYQQSGALPKRKGDGLFPLFGWESKNDWQGIVDPDDLHSAYNPPEGFIVTANNHIQAPGKPVSVNANMGEYRKQRVEQLLRSQHGPFTLDDMKRIQRDLHSIQWDKFSTNILEATRDIPASQAFEGRFWKRGTYSTDSKGPLAFEKIYESLLEISFGPYFDWFNEDEIQIPGVSGFDLKSAKKESRSKIWRRIRSKVLIAYFHYFDNILLSEDPEIQSLVYRNNDIKRHYAKAAQAALKSTPWDHLQTWGDAQSKTHFNLLFGKKFADFTNLLGLNRGPFAIQGGRATVSQGQVWSDTGRDLAFAPSFRLIVDMGSSESYSVLPGGPSGDFMSPWFDSDLNLYYSNQYKKIVHK